MQRKLAFGNGHGGNRKHDWARKKRRRGEKVPVPHRVREKVDGRMAVHVTMRLREGLRSLRSGRVYPLVREALRESASVGVRRGRIVRRGEEAEGMKGAEGGRGRERAFRLSQFSVQANHLHLIVEAEDEMALARGMQGLATRLAKRLNRRWGRRGAVFAERYHASLLRSARQVRHALRYVLNNVLRHRDEGRDGASGARSGPDPCSSGAWFDGWTVEWRRALSRRGAPGRCPVVAARGALLRFLWRRHGLLDPTERPRGVA